MWGWSLQGRDSQPGAGVSGSEGSGGPASLPGLYWHLRPSSPPLSLALKPGAPALRDVGRAELSHLPHPLLHLLYLLLAWGDLI